MLYIWFLQTSWIVSYILKLMVPWMGSFSAVEIGSPAALGPCTSELLSCLKLIHMRVKQKAHHLGVRNWTFVEFPRIWVQGNAEVILTHDSWKNTEHISPVSCLYHWNPAHRLLMDVSATSLTGRWYDPVEWSSPSPRYWCSAVTFARSWLETWLHPIRPLIALWRCISFNGVDQKLGVSRKSTASSSFPKMIEHAEKKCHSHWVGFKEDLQETHDFYH